MIPPSPILLRVFIEARTEEKNVSEKTTKDFKKYKIYIDSIHVLILKLCYKLK